jgi:hypothetical protein
MALIGVPVGTRIFSSPQRPDRLWGSPIQWAPGALSRGGGVRRQGREAGDSPPSSTEVKKSGAVPPILHMLNKLSTGTILLLTGTTLHN